MKKLLFPLLLLLLPINVLAQDTPAWVRYYPPSLINGGAVSGDLEVRDSSQLAGESLTNGVLTAGTSWLRSGDFALTGNAATYTHSTGTGYFYQNSDDAAIPWVSSGINGWFSLTYTVSAVTGTPTCIIDSGGLFPIVSQGLTESAGTYTITFQAISTALSNLAIACTSGAAATITFDTLSLKQINGGDLTMQGTLRLPNSLGDTNPAVVFNGSPWVIDNTSQTFNGVVDPMLIIGSNIRVGSTRIDNTDAAIWYQLEHNYFDGVRYLTETNLNAVSTTGKVRRLYGMGSDRIDQDLYAEHQFMISPTTGRFRIVAIDNTANIWHDFQAGGRYVLNGVLPEIALTATAGATPNKHIRSNGTNLQVVNSAYDAVIFDMSDVGNLKIGLIATLAAAPTIASATTIAPTKPITFISGVTTIETITAPSPISAGGGQITLIPTGVFLTGVTGNIALASTSVVNKALIMTYDTTTTKWYPSY